MDQYYFVVANPFDSFSIVYKKSTYVGGADRGEIYFETYIPDAGDKMTATSVCKLLNQAYADRLEENRKAKEEWELRQMSEPDSTLTKDEVRRIIQSDNV